jgi:hypothetical protein
MFPSIPPKVASSVPPFREVQILISAAWQEKTKQAAAQR